MLMREGGSLVFCGTVVKLHEEYSRVNI